jgi:4-hydroxythreonine-4-phosphate dehydrogenase
MRLAVTLGDPRGIGPEVTAAALAEPASGLDLIAVGPDGTGVHPDIAVGRWDPAADRAEAGRLAGAAVERAIDMALAGEVDGIVTAPLDKAALAAAGYPFRGHTEMLKSLTGATEVAMMMAAEQTPGGNPLRVVLATVHIPLREVPTALTGERLVSQARITDEGLRARWGLARPRLAICAMNPHASDGGLFGDEEARVIAPAVQWLTEEGLSVDGPIPADTVFVRALRGEFDAVIAPYHDVGMAAFKTASFGAGVNITLGLPFVRTSPDHGTALAIAGRGEADPGSMIEAVRMAVRLCRGPEPVPAG